MLPDINLNEMLVAYFIFIFNVLGNFGNFHLLILTYRKKQLRSKSAYLQCIMCICHSFCLIFELPNAYFLLTNREVSRRECINIIMPYIFFINAQAMVMLVTLIDVFLMMIFPIWYQNCRTTPYLIAVCSAPAAYGAFFATWGVLTADTEVIHFCNPPIGLIPTVRNYWIMSHFVISILILSLFVALICMINLTRRRKKQQRDTRRVLRRVQVIMLIFIFSWFMAIFGANLVTKIFSGEMVQIAQSNMVFFALLCYSQPFYAIIWRSKEYRRAFCQLYSLTGKSTAHKSNSLQGKKIPLISSSSFVTRKQTS